MTRAVDYRGLVHNPAELMSEYVAWAQRIQRDPGIPFGVPCVDERVIPMRPGELVSVLGRPGDGKTSLLAYLARATGKAIAAAGDESQVVVYVTWEQSSEELTSFFLANDTYSVSDVAWGRADLETIKRQALHGVQLPVWVIGHGIGRAGQDMPRMTPDVVLKAIETMAEDHGVHPRLMLFDYMQLIPVDNARDRVQQVTEVPILVKELALRVGAPAVVGVQASRDVDTRDVKLAEMRDAQWASSIEQTSDKVFSLWRPIRTEAEGSFIEMDGGTRVQVTDTLLLLRMLKQRGDRGRYTWHMHFDPAYLRLAEMELRTPEVNL